MDKYHIYEEIGKGQFSQVFKGREKKKIEYVAIKRVEKAMMNKIVNEVQVMHKLESPHTLRFYDWYETRNNLWLILEYCTGADLESLLRQDGHLPEASVRMFGLDMLAGLKYMHMQGLLHCDLRPRNFLVDEYGILKIADFKMARKLPKQPLGDTAQDQRGTPAYMAPELFRADGVHSFTSDFWALGCVLYELRRGRPPFGDAEKIGLPELVHNINVLNPIDHPLNSSPPGPVPSMTAKLADLLLWILEKSPPHRCTWSRISVHPFWGSNYNPAPTSLPQEPAFEALVQSIEQARSHELDEATLAEFGLLPHAPPPSRDGADASALPKAVLPPHVSDSTPIRPAAKSGPTMEQQTATKLVEGRGTIAVTAASSSSAHSGPVAEAKAEAKASALTRSNAKSSASEQRQRVAEHKDPAVPSEAAPAAAKSVQAVAHAPAAPQAAHKQGLLHPAHEANFATVTAESLLMHSSDTQVKPIVGNKAIEAVERMPFKASALQFPYLDVAEVSKLSTSEVEAHLSLVYKAMQRANTDAAKAGNTGPTAQTALISERVQIFAYLCSIASSAEVANTVLNTNFVVVLLRLISSKAAGGAEAKEAGSRPSSQSLSRTGSANSSRVASSSSAAAAASSSSSSALSLRVAAATVVATMLRYATLIHPPTAKNKDEHLLPVLVGLLKEPSAGLGTAARLDSRLKKRVVAALGEVLFYVSSQEDDGAPEKWNLSSSAFAVLARALKDDSDEVVRHYAAKTMENIMAQGSPEFRRKLTTVEVATRLLELSQHGRNDAFQASCGMALSHMFFLVMTSESRSAYSASSSAASRGRSSLAHGAHSSPGGAETGPGAGVRFVAKVLEVGGLPAILETLHDGQPKLQQAYLNILCVLFSSPARLAAASPSLGLDETFSQDKDASSLLDRSLQGTTEAALRPTRLFFLKSSTLVPSLVRLVEQGGSAAVRAKAIILAQLLCVHQPSLLAALAERRLPSALVRLLEPLAVSQRVSRDAQAAPPGVTYASSAALCFVRHTLSAGVRGARTAANQLAALAQRGHGASSSSSSSSSSAQLATPDSSPLSKAAQARRGQTSGVRQSSAPAGSSASKRRGTGSTAATPSTPRHGQGEGEGGEPTSDMDVGSLATAADTLRAAVSLASQPLLRRLIVATGPHLAAALADTLEGLVAGRAAASSYAAAAAAATHSPSAAAEAQSAGQAVSRVEQAALAALEAVAHVDALDGDAQLVGAGVDSADNAAAFLETVTTRLVPAAASLMSSHPDGDLRVVVVSSLRRLLPWCLRAHARKAASTSVSASPVSRPATPTATTSGAAGRSVAACLDDLLNHVPAMLCDQPPIPLYAVRMLTDSAMVSLPSATALADGLFARNALLLLVDSLRSQGARSDPFGDHEEQEQDQDPQLPLLLRCLFERTGSSARLLEADLAGALARAVQIAVQRSVGTRSGFSNVVAPLVELLHVVLHFVIRSLSNTPKEVSTPSPAQRGGGSEADGGGAYAAAQQYRRLVFPLRVLCPSLFEILSAAREELDATVTDLSLSAGGGPPPQVDGGAEGAVPLQLQETVSRCLGILFDLFPDAVLEYLLGTGGGGRTPRAVLASIVCLQHMDLRLRVRLLKILAGVANVRLPPFSPQFPLFLFLCGTFWSDLLSSSSSFSPTDGRGSGSRASGSRTAPFGAAQQCLAKLLSIQRQDRRRRSAALQPHLQAAPRPSRRNVKIYIPFCLSQCKNVSFCTHSLRSPPSCKKTINFYRGPCPIRSARR